MTGYFSYLSSQEVQKIFYLPPADRIREIDARHLPYALSAALYMPANRASAAKDVLALKAEGLMSVVLCLEDAIGDKQVEEADLILIEHFNFLSARNDWKDNNKDLPFIFIRVRNKTQMLRIAENLGETIKLLTGFVFPKISANNGREYFAALIKINSSCGKQLFGMPILETPDIMNEETRVGLLLAIKKLLDEYRPLVLNVRIGATDFSGMFGLRRSYYMTVYDINPIRDCISSIINIFMRAGNDYVVSGPVWEYFTGGEKVLKSQLRETPFSHEFGSAGHLLRNTLICRYIDGLIKEVVLDKANGIVGKTIIHPTHLKPVQALSVVTFEEYCDAKSILANTDGEKGVNKSLHANKMNEIKPHTCWAQKIMLKAKMYGGFNEEHNFARLLFSNISK